MASEDKAPRILGGIGDGEAAPVLLEPSLFYDPPYERPLEDEFAWHLVKYLSPITALDYQVKVPTPAGAFWVDFVVEHGGRRIGFECGELDEGATTDEEEVRYRDALILGSGGVDVLYRFRGADLMHRLHDCLFLAARWDAELFSPRGHVNLRTLASPEASAHRPGRGDAVARVAYEAPEATYEEETFTWPGEEGRELVVRRLEKDHPAAWVHTYDEALTHYGITADDLAQRWARSA